MEYCYSGTESLWYGSWNRHLCHKGNLSAELTVLPNRHEEIQVGRRDVVLLRVFDRCIYMWSGTGILTVSFQPRAAKTVWIPCHMGTAMCRLEKENNLFPLELRQSVGKPFPRRPLACSLCHLQCTCFSNENVPWQNRVLHDVKPKYLFVSLIFIFVNKRVPDNSYWSAFKFLVWNGCVKSRKIKVIDACHKIEIIEI